MCIQLAMIFQDIFEAFHMRAAPENPFVLDTYFYRNIYHAQLLKSSFSIDIKM